MRQPKCMKTHIINVPSKQNNYKTTIKWDWMETLIYLRHFTKYTSSAGIQLSLKATSMYFADTSVQVYLV